MNKEDFYHKVIRLVEDDTDECVFVVSAAILKQAGLEIGDTFLVEAREGELVIRKG